MNFQKVEFVTSAANPADFRRDGRPQIAFAGKSNVGKSSVINRVLQRKNFARVGDSPGKTIHVNYFLIYERAYLVDLPGYGYAQAGQKQREKLRQMIERYCLLRQELCSLFVLVDCRHEPQPIDLEFMEWLGENEVPFAIVFTKGDKLGKVRLRENVEAYKQKMLETWVELPPIFVTSAESGMGGDELLQYIESINESVTRN